MVAHPNRVRIGKAHTQLATHRRVVFDDDISFAADVLRGSLDVRPNSGFESLASLVIDHGGFRFVYFARQGNGLERDGSLYSHLLNAKVCSETALQCKGNRGN